MKPKTSPLHLLEKILPNHPASLRCIEFAHSAAAVQKSKGSHPEKRNMRPCHCLVAATGREKRLLHGVLEKFLIPHPCFGSKMCWIYGMGPSPTTPLQLAPGRPYQGGSKHRHCTAVPQFEMSPSHQRGPKNSWKPPERCNRPAWTQGSILNGQDKLMTTHISLFLKRECVYVQILTF